LGSRSQSVDTLGEAQQSSETEIADLQGRATKAKSELDKRIQATQENKVALKEREKKLAAVKLQARTLEGILEKQKKTLEDFEKILKK
jgi:chromosome segregation ATPase